MILPGGPTSHASAGVPTLVGKRGLNVLEVTDPDSAGAFTLELNVALSEFMEAEICQVADLDMAMGAIANGLERIPA